MYYISVCIIIIILLIIMWLLNVVLVVWDICSNIIFDIMFKSNKNNFCIRNA